MKKNYIEILMVLALILTACSATSSSASTTNGNFNSTSLPLAMSLAIGTFKLEGTDNAVTSDQAEQLTPLWQVYKDLTSSTSAAQEEIDGLAEQIHDTMNPEQLLAITDLKLTRRDMFQIMQDLGLSTGRPNASGTPNPGGQGGNFSGGGNFTGGGNGVPGGGQGFNNGQNLSPQQIATFQARRAENGANGQLNRIPPALFDALIKLLEAKQ